MNVARPRGPQRGVTLIELLCVMAIITVLATLVLVPASRVLKKIRADAWGDKAYANLDSLRERLRARFQGATDFPEVTLAALEQDNTLFAAHIRFLHDKRVVFNPFSGRSPTNDLVVLVQIERGFFTSRETLQLTVWDIISPPQ